MSKDQLRTIIAEALAANTDRALSSWDVAVAAANETGLRRAIWHALTPRQKMKLVNEAWKEWKEKDNAD